jgi:proliferating cell nuclear antigen
MFEAKLARAELFKHIIASFKDLCGNVNFECSERGLVLQAMDSTHVALVHLHLTENAFDFYKASRMKVIGTNLHEMARIFNLCRSDDSVTLRFEDRADAVTFTFADGKGSRTADFALRLLDIESEHLGIPEDQEYPATISLPSADFQKICRDLLSVGDTVRLSASKEGLKFTVDGSLGTANVLRKRQTWEFFDLKSPLEPVCASFCLKSLLSFTKATPLFHSVTIQLSPERPLILSYSLGSNDNGSIRFFLAPRSE